MTKFVLVANATRMTGLLVVVNVVKMTVLVVVAGPAAAQNLRGGQGNFSGLICVHFVALRKNF